MLRVIIVDDESASRDLLRRRLQEEPDVEIIAECSNVESALKEIPHHQPDAVFLDVEMPPYTGFDLLARLAVLPKVVLVTAHAGYAIKGFEVAAVDYLLKPIEANRLKQALQRLRGETGHQAGASSSDVTTATESDRMLIRTVQGNMLMAVRSIAALKADGDYTHIYQTSGPCILACQMLGRLLPLVNGLGFERIDRSWCLNLSKVARLEPLANRDYRIWMEGLHEPLVIGRTAGARLRKRLEQNGVRFAS